MPSQLVDDVRTRIREEGRPLTPVERTLLLATLARRGQGATDVVDELEAAIAEGRRVLAVTATADEQRTAVRRLLAAARAVLDHVPADTPIDTTATAPALDRGGRPARADIDG